MTYEMKAGLEVHVELATKSKIFCSCSTSFGAKPNTHCCPICTGQPGTLPVLNKQVVIFAVKAGLALNCKINTRTHLDRKNYFYPDLPKAYQISQYDEPLCENGYILLDSGKKIRIRRIHIEEDAGKLIHENGTTYIDYNRGGVPLIEIVSEPDISTSLEAKEYVEKMQYIMRYLGVSDCKMQEGSLRCDVNISANPQEGESSHTEIKNLNSVSFMVKAMDFEFSRQCSLLSSGGKIEKATLRFDTSSGETYPMRSKEDEQDYRYFPEPDIPAIEIEEELIECIKSSLPELPDDKKARYASLGISEGNVELLYKYHKVCKFLDDTLSFGADTKHAVNLIVGTIYSTLKTEEEKENFSIGITAKDYATLLKYLQEGKINITLAQSTLLKMLELSCGPDEFLSAQDLSGVSDDDLFAICKKAVEGSPKAVEDYKKGKEKAIFALFGVIRKETGGKGDIKKAESIIKQIISKM